MRALSLLLLTGLMTGACVSTGRDGTTLPGAPDKQSPQTATAHAAAAPEAGNGNNHSLVLRLDFGNLSQERHSAYSYGHPNQKAIDLLVHQTDGVSGKRAPIVVDVGVKGLNPKTGAPPVFTTMTIDRAVYAVSWDGTIIVEAKKDGTLRVLTSK